MKIMGAATAVWFVGCIVLSGCSNKQREAGDGEATVSDGTPVPVTLEKLAGRMMRFGKGSPTINLRLFEIDPEGTTSETVILDDAYELEFLLATSDSSTVSLSIATYLIEGGKEELLAETRAVAMPSESSVGDDRLAALESVTRIDLSPYRGKSVAFRWIMRPRDSGVSTFLVNFRLDPKPSSGPRQPDILVICSDTHRYDYSFGDAGARLMPRLHALKSESVVYQHAFSTASWTLPSIVSFLTGFYPRYHLTGERIEMGELDELDKEAIPAGQFYIPWMHYYRMFTAYPNDLTTLTEMLRRERYTTAIVSANPFYFTSGLYEDGQDIAIQQDGAPGSKLNALALRLLNTFPRKRPIFMLVHYMDVHQYRYTYFERDNPDMYAWSAPPEKLISSYESAVKDSDRILGEMIDAWDQAIGLKDSLVIFFSDHGEHLFDPGHPSVNDIEPRNARDSHAGLPIIDHGNSMQDVLLHVPLLVKYPESAAIGAKEIESPVSLLDVFPTVLDLLNIDRESIPINGVSLLEVHNGGLRGDLEPPRSLFADYQLYGDELSSIRQGPFKLVINHSTQSQTLIDVRLPYLPAGEPGQTSDNARRAEELQRAIDEFVAAAQSASQDLTSDQVIRMEDETLDGLRALGYIR